MNEFDAVSYIIGNKSGYGNGYDAGYDAGYEEGEAQGAGEIIITGSITCTDANHDGNIIITEG